MSNNDVTACRRTIEAHIENIVEARSTPDHSSLSEAESRSLVQGVQSIRSHNPEETWTSQSPTDTALRELLFDLVSSIAISDPGFVRVWYLLDIATILADNELSEPSSNFLLIESLLDSQTVSGCRKVFDYLESQRDELIARNFKFKNLVILRCCNELLRRLSRAEDTVFCGRVFIFLFQSFPLGDRSSVNLRGEFHAENVTHFDPVPKKSEDAIKPMDIDSAQPASSGAQTPASTAPDTDTHKTGRSTPIPGKTRSEHKPSETPPDLDELFPQFWSLQGLFSMPTRLFEPAAMNQFKESIAATLSCFKSISTSTNASANSARASRGTKRKRSDDGSRMSQPYNPKYLTNRDLFDLEVHDLAFRRHILAQCLIMLDFLLSLTPPAKAKTAGLINKAVLYGFTLSEEDTKYCQSTRQSIASYLQQQGPGNDGKMYYRMVDTVLSRDKNWARWKAESCPYIRRDPVEAKTYLATQQSLGAMTEKKPSINPPGAADFNFLSQSESLESLKQPSKRYKVPTPDEYYKSIEGDKLDEDFVANEEERKDLHERIQGKLWRALRASALDGRRFALCEKIKDGSNLKALIGEEEEQNLEATDATGMQEEDTKNEPSINGEQQEGVPGEKPQETAAAISAAVTPLQQTDGAGDIAEQAPEAETEAAAASTVEATVDEIEDNEFAPPGAMDVDEGNAGEEVVPPAVEAVETDKGEAETATGTAV